MPKTVVVNLALLKKHRLTVAHAARNVGVSWASMNRTFRGKNVPNLQRARKLAQLFGTSLDSIRFIAEKEL